MNNIDKQPQTDGTIFQFLQGSHSYDGIWFGEPVDGMQYWWREILSKELAADKTKWQREAANKAWNSAVAYTHNSQSVLHGNSTEWKHPNKESYLNIHYPLPQQSKP